MTDFLKCPDANCKCLFLTKHDLERHLEVFGNTHADALKELHEIATNHYTSMEFSDADRSNASWERWIKQYREGGLANVRP